MLADSRYTVQARREAPDAASRPSRTTWRRAGRSCVASIGARRVAVPAGTSATRLWEALAAAAPDVELVPAEPWVDEERPIKEPAEIERIAAACAVADRALARCSPRSGRA